MELCVKELEIKKDNIIMSEIYGILCIKISVIHLFNFEEKSWEP